MFCLNWCDYILIKYKKADMVFCHVSFLLLIIYAIRFCNSLMLLGDNRLATKSCYSFLFTATQILT